MGRGLTSVLRFFLSVKVTALLSSQGAQREGLPAVLFPSVVTEAVVNPHRESCHDILPQN